MTEFKQLTELTKMTELTRMTEFVELTDITERTLKQRTVRIDITILCVKILVDF